MVSKIGKKQIQLPAGVSLEGGSGKVVVTGPKGTVTVMITDEIDVKVEGGMVSVLTKGKNKESASEYGTARAKIANAVLGVTGGWSRQLELVGTGYRAEVNGNTLVLTIGYSHPVKIEGPAGISFKVEKSIVTIGGVDRELVGQTAAKVRAVRPPEPYQGKGIKYVDEIIRRKPGKAAKTIGAGPA